MIMTIYNEIEKLQATFTGTAEFDTLKKAVEEVRSDEEAKTLFVNFREVQKQLQQKQAQGEAIVEDEYLYLQKTAQLAQSNVKILAMLEAEMAMSAILEEVNRSLVEPIQSLYDGL